MKYSSTIVFFLASLALAAPAAKPNYPAPGAVDSILGSNFGSISGNKDNGNGNSADGNSAGDNNGNGGNGNKAGNDDGNGNKAGNGNGNGNGSGNKAEFGNDNNFGNLNVSPTGPLVEVPSDAVNISPNIDM